MARGLSLSEPSGPDSHPGLWGSLCSGPDTLAFWGSPSPHSLATLYLLPHTQQTPSSGFTPAIPFPGEFSPQMPVWLASPLLPIICLPRHHPSEKSSPALLSKTWASPVSLSTHFIIVCITACFYNDMLLLVSTVPVFSPPECKVHENRDWGVSTHCSAPTH